MTMEAVFRVSLKIKKRLSRLAGWADIQYNQEILDCPLISDNTSDICDGKVVMLTLKVSADVLKRCVSKLCP